MSYPRDLDEYDDEDLQEELDRRAELKKKGLCTYCKRKVTASACRFPERHKAGKNGKGGKIKTPVLVIGDTAYELSEAFCEGALAYHARVPYNVGNPYNDEDDRAEEWNDGHTIASSDKDDNCGVEFTKEQAEKALAVAKKRRL